MKSLKRSLLISVLLILLVSVFVGCNDKTTKPEPKAKVGDIITFGGYEWLVLDIEGGRALVVSKDIVEQREYHASYT